MLTVGEHIARRAEVLRAPTTSFAITGCGVCPESQHERSLRGAGVSHEVIGEVLRAGAVSVPVVTLDAEAALG